MKKNWLLIFSMLFLLGFSTSMHSQRLQAIHNMSDVGLDIIDVYIKVSIITIDLQDIAYRSALPMTDIPFPNLPINVGVAPGNSSSASDTVKSFRATLQSGLTYAGMVQGVQNPAMYAPNPDGRNTGLSLTLTDAAREVSTVAGSVQFAFSHGVTDAPTVDLVVDGVTQANGVAYTDLTSYITVTPGQHVVDIKDQSGATLRSFDVDLSAWADSAMIIYLSGFQAPSQNQNGAEIALVAGTPGGTSINFPIVVPNMPPLVANPVVDQNKDEDFATFTAADLATVFNDSDSPSLAYAVSTDGNTTASLNGTNVMIASVLNVNGSSQVIVSADDGEFSVSDTFQVNIAPINDPPVLTNITDISFPEDSMATLGLDPFVDDVDNNDTDIDFAANVIAASAAPGVEIDVTDLMISIDPVSHVATFTTSMDSAGNFTVVFTATDPNMASDTDTINVTVSPENDPPFIFTGGIPDIMIMEDSGTNTIRASLYNAFGDVDNDVLIFSASVDGSGLSVSTAGDSLEVTPDPDYFGMNQVIVTASDGIASVSDTFQVTTNNVNDAPGAFALAAPQDNFIIADANLPISFEWQAATDIDGDALTYDLRIFNGSQDTTVSAISGTMVSFNGSNFWQPNAAYSWTAIVDDGTVSISSSDTFAISYPTVDITDTFNEIPKSFALDQNYPNPFNPNTHIRFGLPNGAYTTLTVYNMLGQPVAMLVNGFKSAGFHGVDFDASQLPSGIYLYQIEAGGFVQVRKMILMK